MLKRTMTAAALAVALATPAFAQQTAPMTPAQQGAQGSAMNAGSHQAGFLQKQQANQWRGSKLIGASVYGPDNTSIGEINDVLISDTGSIGAVVVGVGGLLGVGEKDVALPFDALNIKPNQSASGIDQITVSYTKDQLKNAPQFAYNKPPQTTGAGSGSRPMPGPNR